MKKFVDALLFAIFVSLPMVMLDALYHLGTNTAVHINYVLVKVSIIFLVTFLIALFNGKGFNQAIFTVIAGPTIFYIYYVFADATLNRALFTIDDSFGYIFLHILAFIVSYYVVYNYLFGKNKSLKNFFASFILAFSVFGLDAFYQLGKVQLATHNEELVVHVLHFDLGLYFALALLVVGFVLVNYVPNKNIRNLLYVIATIDLIYWFSGDVVRSLVGILAAAIPLLLFDYYTSNKLYLQGIKVSKNILALAFIITGTIGSIYHFVKYSILTKTLHLGFGLRHNDHIMIGSIGIVIAACCLFSLLYNKK